MLLNSWPISSSCTLHPMQFGIWAYPSSKTITASEMLHQAKNGPNNVLLGPYFLQCYYCLINTQVLYLLPWGSVLPCLFMNQIPSKIYLCWGWYFQMSVRLRDLEGNRQRNSIFPCWRNPPPVLTGPLWQTPATPWGWTLTLHWPRAKMTHGPPSGEGRLIYQCIISNPST